MVGGSEFKATLTCVVTVTVFVSEDRRVGLSLTKACVPLTILRAWTTRILMIL